MTQSKREIIERSVKQLNTYGNGIGVLGEPCERTLCVL